MSSEQMDNGGPVFPITDCASHQFHGMSLRDYFVGQELAKAQGAAICDESAVYDRVADHCYRMADAMLKVRAAAQLAKGAEK
jgi:hypothetical protein